MFLETEIVLVCLEDRRAPSLGNASTQQFAEASSRSISITSSTTCRRTVGLTTSANTAIVHVHSAFAAAGKIRDPAIWHRTLAFSI